jgi:hypothetical protein
MPEVVCKNHSHNLCLSIERKINDMMKVLPTIECITDLGKLNLHMVGWFPARADF